jgi:hypothetical protein
VSVGPLQLLIAQVRMRLVQAVPADTRLVFLPRLAGPVLKACAVPWSVAARSQSPASPAMQGQAQDGAG